MPLSTLLTRRLYPDGQSTRRRALEALPFSGTDYPYLLQLPGEFRLTFSVHPRADKMAAEFKAVRRRT
jgi:hypothetical protein